MAENTTIGKPDNKHAKSENIREVIPALSKVPELESNVAEAFLQELELYRKGIQFNEQ